MADLRKPGPHERVGSVTPEEAALIETGRSMFDNLDALIRTKYPDGRERAMALTHLEIAGMFPTKSVTHVPRAVA
ncbi:MAG: hypothetical protein JWM87_797 [Candidatus Eremiobacteraeota bacterium]|nr:hypothetical protein [Candidatus Eremiobacteraeota bacterium]